MRARVRGVPREVGPEVDAALEVVIAVACATSQDLLTMAIVPASKLSIKLREGEGELNSREGKVCQARSLGSERTS